MGLGRRWPFAVSRRFSPAQRFNSGNTVMKNLFATLPFLAVAFFLAACATDDRSVVSIPLRTHIETIYVVDNSAAVENENLLPAIVSQLAGKGILPVLVKNADNLPEDYVLTYSGRMTGHTLRTLADLRIEVRKGGRLLGYGFTDAAGSMDRYDSTADRVRSLLDGIFKYVTVGREPVGAASR